MSERWKDYIVGGVARAGGPVPFALAQWSYLQPVFLAIRRALPEGGRILDVGCGAGIFTSLVAHHGYHATGIDDDDGIVGYAQEMAAYFRSPLPVERASAADLHAYHGRFDLVYSLGVVEHFDAHVTVELVREQLKCAPLVLVAIPTPYTRFAAPVQDERFYSRRQFNGLIRRAGARIRESFVFGDVPTPVAINAHRVLPPSGYRAFRHVFTCAMQLCTVAERI